MTVWNGAACGRERDSQNRRNSSSSELHPLFYFISGVTNGELLYVQFFLVYGAGRLFTPLRAVNKSESIIKKVPHHENGGGHPSTGAGGDSGSF